MKRMNLTVILAVSLLTVAVGWAQSNPAGESQTTQAEKESPKRGEPGDEEMMKRLERWKNESPKGWQEFVAEWLTPRKYEKSQVVRINERLAYPHVAASIKMEVVREDEEHIWLRGLPPEDPQSPLYRVWAQRQADEARMVQAAEAMATPGAVYFLDFGAEPVPPPTQTSLRFVAPQNDLPAGGRWQMNFAAGDMNEDGHLDLVFPPRRQTYPPRFALFLGDGTGRFTEAQEARWPENLRIDYGGVSVADLDEDGHLDIIAAIHFGPQYVLYGDGKGDFTRTERLPIHDPRLSSRASTVADFDGDGHKDVAFVAEIDFDMKSNEKLDGLSTIWVLYRRGTGWKVVSKGFPETHIGDVISADDVNRDGRTDLIVASNNSGERRLVYLNGGGESWSPARFNGVLSSAYHYDIAYESGEYFSTFVQFKPVDGKTSSLNGIVAYPFAFREEGWRNGETVVYDRDRTNVYFRVAVGDLNGDDRLDMVAARKNGGIEVFVRQADGQFILERTEAFANTGTVYGLELIDLDGDGRDDIIATFVPSSRNQGGFKVWLTRGIDEAS